MLDGITIDGSPHPDYGRLSVGSSRTSSPLTPVSTGLPTPPDWQQHSDFPTSSSSSETSATDDKSVLGQPEALDIKTYQFDIDPELAALSNIPATPGLVPPTPGLGLTNLDANGTDNDERIRRVLHAPVPNPDYQNMSSPNIYAPRAEHQQGASPATLARVFNSPSPATTTATSTLNLHATPLQQSNASLLADQIRHTSPLASMVPLHPTPPHHNINIWPPVMPVMPAMHYHLPYPSPPHQFPSLIANMQTTICPSDAFPNAFKRGGLANRQLMTPPDDNGRLEDQDSFYGSPPFGYNGVVNDYAADNQSGQRLGTWTSPMSAASGILPHEPYDNSSPTMDVFGAQAEMLQAQRQMQLQQPKPLLHTKKQQQQQQPQPAVALPPRPATNAPAYIPTDESEVFYAVANTAVGKWTFIDDTRQPGDFDIRICHHCQTDQPGGNTWRRSTCENYILCNKCGIYLRTHQRKRPPKSNDHRAHFTLLQLAAREPGQQGRNNVGGGGGGPSRSKSPKAPQPVFGGLNNTVNINAAAGNGLAFWGTGQNGGSTGAVRVGRPAVRAEPYARPANKVGGGRRRDDDEWHP